MVLQIELLYNQLKCAWEMLLNLDYLLNSKTFILDQFNLGVFMFSEVAHTKKGWNPQFSHSNDTNDNYNCNIFIFLGYT